MPRRMRSRSYSRGLFFYHLRPQSTLSMRSFPVSRCAVFHLRFGTRHYQRKILQVSRRLLAPEELSDGRELRDVLTDNLEGLQHGHR